MPILTPVFPQKNSAYTVRPSTLRTVISEFKRASKYLHAIIEGQASWEDLFQPFDVTAHFNHFLLWTLTVPSRDNMKIAAGLVDSKLRHLAQDFEEQSHICSARISSIPTTNQTSDEPDSVRRWLVALEIESAPRAASGARIPLNVDLSGCVASFYSMLQEKDPYINFGKVLSHAYIKKSELRQLIM